MRRLWLVPLVLVLGAWGPCAPVSSGGDGSMAGPTTTGLAALVAGEDWHYVGETDEPAFENGWANVGSSNKLAFRIREAGIVDLQGIVTGGSGARIFTLPDGYHPTTVGRTTFFPSQAFKTPDYQAIRITVDNNGYVQVIGASGLWTLYISGQFFLDPPT